MKEKLVMKEFKINNKIYIVGKYYFCNKNLYMKIKNKPIAFIKGKKYLFKRERYNRLIFIDEMKQEHSIFNLKGYNHYAWLNHFDNGRKLKINRINGSN